MREKLSLFSGHADAAVCCVNNIGLLYSVPVHSVMSNDNNAGLSDLDGSTSRHCRHHLPVHLLVRTTRLQSSSPRSLHT